MAYATFTEELLGKTLPELENFDPGPFPAGMEWSSVVRTMYEVYCTPLAKLTPEQIRMSLAQRTGYKYPLPLAVDILDYNPLILCRHYDGDLLSTVLKCPDPVWLAAPDLREVVLTIAKRAVHTLITEQPYKTEHIGRLKGEIARLEATS